MNWKGMLREMDSEEFMYQAAYDMVEAREQAEARPSTAPKPPGDPHLIELDAPDTYERLKRRLGIS